MKPTVTDRLDRLRAEFADVWAEVVEAAPGMSREELVAACGAVQGLVNAADGAQLVAMGYAARFELRNTSRGLIEVTREVGFVDEFAASEIAVETGVGVFASGRRVELGAAAAARFPAQLAQVVAGELWSGVLDKVVTVCEDLDDEACALVAEVLGDRLVGMDPARVTTFTKRVATRVAGAQLAAAAQRNTRQRRVTVRAGQDGLAEWFATLSATDSAAMWAAVDNLATTYREDDPELTVDQARADALVDLVLNNVEFTTKVTIGIPVLDEQPPTTPNPQPASPAAQPAADTAEGAGLAVPAADVAAADESVGGQAEDAPADSEELAEQGWASVPGWSGIDHETGEEVVLPKKQQRLPAPGPEGTCPVTFMAPVAPGVAVSGCLIPGGGWIEPSTVAALIRCTPLEVARALLDAQTGILRETKSRAYVTPKEMRTFVTTRDGTCRMWGCTRPAVTCDLDHARAWPHGDTCPTNLAGLCRRHHRMKQQDRWKYRLAEDGTVTWTSPTGIQRITVPQHAWLTPRQTARKPEPAPARVRVAPADDPPPF